MEKCHRSVRLLSQKCHEIARPAKEAHRATNDHATHQHPIRPKITHQRPRHDPQRPTSAQVERDGSEHDSASEERLKDPREPPTTHPAPHTQDRTHTPTTTPPRTRTRANHPTTFHPLIRQSVSPLTPKKRQTYLQNKPIYTRANGLTNRQLHTKDKRRTNEGRTTGGGSLSSHIV